MATRDAAREIIAIQERLVGERLPVPTRGALLRQQAQLWDDQFPGAAFEQVAKRAELQSA